MAPPKDLANILRVVGTIELDDFIQDFDTAWDMQQFLNPQLFIPFLVWKGLFQHLEGPPMDGYHEFYQVHQINIEDWHLYWSPNYFSIT